ncbi:hypothetical protein VULLAG_LOCUS12274 [Vulpes lagopus]
MIFLSCSSFLDFTWVNTTRPHTHTPRNHICHEAKGTSQRSIPVFVMRMASFRTIFVPVAIFSTREETPPWEARDTTSAADLQAKGEVTPCRVTLTLAGGASENPGKPISEASSTVAVRHCQSAVLRMPGPSLRAGEATDFPWRRGLSPAIHLCPAGGRSRLHLPGCACKRRRESVCSPGGDALISMRDKSQLEIQVPDNLITETLSSNP